MRKVYKVTGVSPKHPGNLPPGFTVTEKEVGDVHQIEFAASGRHANFVETKQGDVVIYREGVENSNFKIKHDQLPGLIRFLNQVWLEHRDQNSPVLAQTMSDYRKFDHGR